MGKATDDWMQESDAEKQIGRGNGIPRLTLKDGESVQVRFVSKRKEACISWKQHPEHPRIVSPKTADPNAKCYFSELAEKTGDTKLYPRWRCYILVLNRTKNNELQMWDFSMTTKAEIRKILENRFDVQDSPGGLMDFDVKISRKGSSMEDTEYNLVFAKKATPLTDAEKNYVNELCPNIDKEFEPCSYETVKGWMEGTRSGGRPTPPGASGASRPQPSRGASQTPLAADDFGPAPVASGSKVSDNDTLF